MQSSRIWLVIVGLSILLLPVRGTAGQTTGPNTSRYFPATGHAIKGLFLAYWDQHGGLVQQGYPLSEEIQAVSPTDNKIYTVQYFERAVFEYHPENKPPYDVLLSLLGVNEYHQRYGATGATNQQINKEQARTFPQTGHTLGRRFRAYWEAHGGLAQQGYPISDEFTEISSLDHKLYTVQYFERAVFEWHSENAGTPYEVLLSQLGSFKDIQESKDLHQLLHRQALHRAL